MYQSVSVMTVLLFYGHVILLNAQPLLDAWSCKNGDPQHHGRAVKTDTVWSVNGGLKWKYEPDSISMPCFAGYGNAPVYGNGVLFVPTYDCPSGNKSTEYPGRLIAFNGSTGTILWSSPGLQWGWYSAAAVAAEGTVYAAGFVSSSPTDCIMYAFKPNGQIQWQRPQESCSFMAAPVIAYDGTILWGGANGKLYAIHNDGSMVWTCQIGSETDLVMTPAVAQDGTVYAAVAGSGGCVSAISPQGTLQWVHVLHISPEYTVFPELSLAADILYVNTGTLIIALSVDDGTTQWQTAVYGGFHAAAIATDGTLYSCSLVPGLVALHPNGSLKWELYLPSGAEKGLSILADRSLIVSGLNAVFNVDSNGLLLWTWPVPSYTGDYRFPSPSAVGTDGTVYVASHWGVYAFEAVGQPAPTWTPSALPAGAITQRVQATAVLGCILLALLSFVDVITIV